MGKRLEEMSLAELWQLFPVFLVEHRNEWTMWYAQEKRSVLSHIPAKYLSRISHIGSTAIPEIWAKNIVDILLEVNSETGLDKAKDALLAEGWLCMNQSPARITLNKGYTEQGFADRVFHLHIRIAGDNDELYFRDYLQEHKAAAKEYEALKLSLWKKFEHDRDGYTEAKTDFIQRITALAREKYRGRYAAKPQQKEANNGV